MGGLGLRSATRTRQAAYWASWADSLPWRGGCWLHCTMRKAQSRHDLQPLLPISWQGQTGIRGRECSSQNLPGGWRSRDGEHDGEGHGFGFASCSRRRLEIVADGLPLSGGMQLAVDTTLVSPLHCDGSARPGAAQIDGAVLTVARRKKERTYPELMGPHARARLVGGMSLVQGDPDFPPTSGPGEGEVGTTHPPSQGGTSVEIAVGLHPCMQRCSFLRCISAEPQVWEWC